MLETFKDYLDSEFIGIRVWPVVLIVSAILIYIALTRNRIALIILGGMLIIAAVPATIGAVVTFGGCCGDSSGFGPLGYALGLLPALLGVVLIVWAIRRGHKK